MSSDMLMHLILLACRAQALTSGVSVVFLGTDEETTGRHVRSQLKLTAPSLDARLLPTYNRLCRATALQSIIHVSACVPAMISGA